ncbi:MAG: ABC transporter ATP-binding protein [Thermodesulfobacteriota bacterium]
MLLVQGVSKSFDHFLAVREANLEVKKGEIVAVIGPNGAGKTTLFRLITGQHKPDAGRIIFQDEEITGLAPHQIARKGISLSYQVVNVFHRLTAFENVQVAVLAHHRRTLTFFKPAAGLLVAETEAILAAVGLLDKARRASGALSHGDQKVLEIAIALGNRPRLLIMDEPTAGMSPEETAATIGLIRRLTSEMGLTILFCEHDMELVFAIADRIMVMRQGLSIIQGECDLVRCDERVIEAYLGGPADA